MGAKSAALLFVSTIFLSILIYLGCTGTEDRCPSPSAPDADPPMVAGFWSGTATLEGVDGCGCVGASFQAEIGTSSSFADELFQTRATIRGVIIEMGSLDQLNAGTCNYAGETFDNGILLDSTDRSHPAITRTCSGSRTTNTLTFKSYRKRGPVSSARIQADIDVIFTCTGPTAPKSAK